MATGDSSGWDRWWRAARDAVRALPHRNSRRTMIGYGLDAAYERAGDPEPFDLRTDRLVIFSDHHRGGGDGADDFRGCERAYRSALAHYLELGHTLVLLGDVDELWESRLPTPLKTYPEVLELERSFHRLGRLRRFYGNHDLVYSRPSVVEKYLSKEGEEPIEVRESLKLDVHDGDESLGQLFLTHGHQGTPDSDLWAPAAMIPVRYFWPKLQRSVKFASTSPAKDYALREGHDASMFEWAKKQARKGRPLVLITGHTHKPVFRKREVSGGLPGEAPAQTEAEVRAALAGARTQNGTPEQLAQLHAMAEFLATKDYGAPPMDVAPPCYFNTGCCSFGDGDVTGLEISGGNISLVRWLNDEEKPEPCELASEPLSGMFAEVEAWLAG